MWIFSIDPDGVRGDLRGMSLLQPTCRFHHRKGDTMIALILLTILLVASTSSASGGPNEPPGSKVLLDSDNSAFPPRGFTNIYPGCNGFAGTDSSAPKSAPGVYIEVRAAGTNNPPPTGGCSINGAFSPVRNIYGAMWYKTSNPYSGVTAGPGTKLTGYMQQQLGNIVGLAFHGQNEYNYHWYNASPGLNGWQGNCQYAGQPWFYDPQASVGNPECSFGAIIYPNVQYVGGGVGQWTLIEWYMQLGTCQTCNNGILKWWVNGVLSGSYNNYNYVDSPFTAWGMTHTWDGVNHYLNPAIEDRIITDHMYLSTVGGNAPVDNPPGPPVPPTGVTVTVR